MPIRTKESASVLMTVLLTIAVICLVLATTISIGSSKYSTTFQDTSWQESLQGAEAGVDIAMAALNTGTWTGWTSVTGTPPRGDPTASGTGANDYPISTTYNYTKPSNLTHVGEGNNTVSMMVTVDTAGLPLDKNGNQWFRIRSIGTADISGPPRVSSEKLDNRLRKVSLVKDRVTNAPVTNGKGQVSRYIEVIAQPVAQSIWTRGITLKGKIDMSGGGTIDSFDSSDPFKSSTINGIAGQYDVTKRQSHGDTATTNSGTNSDLHSTYLYGNLTYSGSPIKNTVNVQGTVSTPFAATIPPVASPGWTAGQYTATPTLINGTTTLTVSGNKNNPTRYKLSAVTVSGSNVVTIAAATSGSEDRYVEVWVTGNFTTSGTGKITQDPLVHVTYYIAGDVTISGQSCDNRSGRAENLIFNCITPASGNPPKFTVSGSGALIAAINAPGSDFTISGTGSVNGSMIGNTLVISGGASFHYDEALNSADSGGGASNFAFASWFEDVR